jgi:uncharacterized protein YjbJ (UPF0337 family)
MDENENQVGGAVRRAAGRMQGAAGEFLGDARAQVEGAARDVAGRAQEAYGGARDLARSGAARVGRGVERQPVIALLIVGAIGYALGLLTAYAVSARR